MRWSLLWTAVWLPLSLAGVGPRRQREDVVPLHSQGDQDLAAEVRILAKQVAEISAKQSREGSRIRRVERRGRSARIDIDVMQADVTHLRHQVEGITRRLNGLDDVTAGLKLEVTEVTSEQRQLQKIVGDGMRSHNRTRRRLDDLEKLNTDFGSRADSTQHHVTQVEEKVKATQANHRHVLSQLDSLESLVRQHHRRRHQQHHDDEKTRTTGAYSPSQENEAGKIKESFVSQGRHGNAQSGERAVQTELNWIPHSGQTPYRPQRQGPGTDDVQTEKSSGDEDPQLIDLGSGDSEDGFIIVDHISKKSSTDTASGRRKISDVIYGHREMNGMGRKSPPPEPKKTGEIAGEKEEGEGDDQEEEGGVLEGEEGLSVTPLTTNTVPTLTSVTTPTSPTHPCPDVSELERRVAKLESSTRLRHHQRQQQTTPPSQDHAPRQSSSSQQAAPSSADHAPGQSSSSQQASPDHALQEAVNRTERLEAALREREEELMQGQARLAELFEAINSTQLTQSRVTQLADSVTTNTRLTSGLHKSLLESRKMCEHQYRLLQSHVIRLNNSLQDILEFLDIAPYQLYPGKALKHSTGRLPEARTPSQPDMAEVTSRLDDLDLEQARSDSRLSRVEIQLMNASLAACSKANTDLHQDANLQRIDRHLTSTQSDVLVLKDTIRRFDLGLYRLHGHSKANHAALRSVQGQVKDMANVKARVASLQKNMENLLFQLPVDCNDYYKSGHLESGSYVIYPPGAAQSVKVRCVMLTAYLHDNPGRDGGGNIADDDNDIGDYGAGSAPIRLDDGGWTVIQHRHSGKVDFNASWTRYAEGFGSAEDDLWLGNEALHALTSRANYTLAVLLVDSQNRRWVAEYRLFTVGDRESQYRLGLGRYRGNATDTLREGAGLGFSAYDRDNDVSSGSCAGYAGGGWWYSHCPVSSLNGRYPLGLLWFHTGLRDWLQVRTATMMVRAQDDVYGV